METLTIRLLGNPEVMVARRPLSFPTRKVLALLVYLVVEDDRPSRETLMALLWPENSPEKAALNLRGTLSRLRKVLQPAGEYLLSEGNAVAFDFTQAHELDLTRLAAAGRPESSPDELHSAVALDRGEFLAGFSLPDAPGFDTWAAIRREACQRRLETVYDRLSQHLLATHDSAAAVDTAARWVTRAPLSEQAYRRLMAAQALSGQRPAALQTYERLRATLEQDLDLEPSRETVVLADNISQGRVSEEPPGPVSTVGTDQAGAAGYRLALPLVGRSDEHSRLVAAFGRAGQNEAQVVAVIGAAGSGKSRLANAFLEWARLDMPQAEVWQGRAFETGGRLAYQPIVDALRPRLEAVNAPEDLLDDVWLAELSQLMPELRARYPDLPPPMTGDAQFVRARLFEAVVLLGNALTAGVPAVLALDDMQWADADTLDLLHYLARRWTETGAPILLLLVIRQEAYAADTALREWLTSLGRDAPVSRLLLDNLSGAAVEQLVKHLAGEEEDETASAFAAWLWAETRGLPFFIEALLQMLVEQSILPVTGGDPPDYDFDAALNHVRSLAQVPLPPGVREVIQARLARHSKGEGAMLLAAAVLGRACTFERLCQLADLSESDALEALEPLLNSRLMTERPADRRPYTLAHDYIREVVYSESHEARRRVFHRRALLALEAANAPAAECAFHALAALLDEPAFRYSVAAGHEAFATYATQEALDHFNTARDVARRMQERGESVDADLLGRLYKRHGQALELLNDDKAAQNNYEEMRTVARQRRDQTLELASLISQSFLHANYTSVFNPPKARELAQQALALARELGDKGAEAGALWGLMVIEVTSAGDMNMAVGYGRKAETLARDLGLKELMGRILNVLCLVLFGQMQIELAREAASESKSIWRELGNLPQLAQASRYAVIINYGIGDYRRMLTEAPELVELGASIGSRVDEGQGWTHMALGHARQGRMARALEFTEKVGDLSAAIGHANEENGHQYVRIVLYLAAGALEEAERWADRLYAQRENIMPALAHSYLTQAAQAKIMNGKLDQGQALLDELLTSLPAGTIASWTVVAIMVAYAHLNLALGEPEALFAGLEEQVRPYREAGFTFLLADENWLRGRAAIALGQYDKARAVLLKAREAAEAQEERTILWQILVSMAEVEAACGDAAAADRLRGDAREVVSFIADHAGDLRGAFLAQPAVARLFGSD
jgi:DNA-binding SARP family transcriptional activator